MRYAIWKGSMLWKVTHNIELLKSNTSRWERNGFMINIMCTVHNNKLYDTIIFYSDYNDSYSGDNTE